MKVVTAEEMRRIDERAQAEFAIPGDELMERAGVAVARLVVERSAPERVCVVCGGGNNGGDGYVAARELHAWGTAVEVIALAPGESLRGSAARAFQRAAAGGVAIRGAECLQDALQRADLVIDAVLGIGVRGAPSGAAAEAISAINAAGRPVLAVDVPSGLRENLSRDDEDGPVAVRATRTLTIGLPKVPLLTLPGVELAGEVIVEPIQFPRELLEDESLQHNFAPAEELARWLPVRPADSNKGDFGRVGVVAGSASFAGAAVLIARAALRSGCGLVYVFTTRELNPIFKVALPEAVSVIVPSGSPDWMDESSAEAIREKVVELDALAIGPGLGTAPPQRSLVRRLVAELRTVPMVLDADALTNLGPPEREGERPIGELLAGRTDCVLTPHPGEMARLLGGNATAADVQKDRIATARMFAKKCGANLLLKGASTVVARPDGQVWINPGATSALAKGGTGDVLAGLVASLIAQGMDAPRAAVLAAAVHLDAGRRGARRTGEYGVLAGEVADELSPALKDLARRRP